MITRIENFLMEKNILGLDLLQYSFIISANIRSLYIENFGA